VPVPILLNALRSISDVISRAFCRKLSLTRVRVYRYNEVSIWQAPAAEEFPRSTARFDRRESMDARNVNVGLCCFALATRHSPLATAWWPDGRRSSLCCRRGSCRTSVAAPRTSTGVVCCLAVDAQKEFPSPGRRLSTCLLSQFRRARQAASGLRHSHLRKQVRWRCAQSITWHYHESTTLRCDRRPSP
jgi:hypothetical protein